MTNTKKGRLLIREEDSVNKGLIARMSLGTAQLGLDYGIANKKGKVSREEAFKMLEYAHDLGIDALDTAYSYGESEDIIGKFVLRTWRKFNIVSKLPDIGKYDTFVVEKYFFETLKKLKQARIYSYLIHKFDNLMFHKRNLWNKIESLKEQGLVSKVGISLYQPEELEYLLEEKIPFDVIQIPYNLFDRRFEEYFPILKERKTEIYVRSVFL